MRLAPSNLNPFLRKKGKELNIRLYLETVVTKMLDHENEPR
jgi:hypothetical protein